MRTALKLILPLIISVLVVSLLFAAYQVRTDRRILRNDLSRRAEILAESLQENVEPQFDRPLANKTLQHLVDRFGQREHLTGVAVYDANGIALAVTSGLASLFQLRPAVAARAAERAWQRGAQVVVLPVVPFGVNTGQLDIPLCINMNPSTQALVLRDVALSLAGQGIGKLVIFNGHGANDFRQMIRELQPQVSLFLCVVNWYKVLDLKGFFSDQGDHAGEMETSVMQHVAPERALPLSEAGPGAARKFKIAAFREGWAWAPRNWRQVTDDTGSGDPAAATAEKGKRYLEAVTAKIADFLVDLAKADTTKMYD